MSNTGVVRTRQGGQSFQSIGGALYETDLGTGTIKEMAEESPPDRASVPLSYDLPKAPSGQREAKAAAQPELTKPGAIVKAARARIREINRDLKRLAALKKEKEELERLVAAAKTKPSPKVRALRTG